MFDFSLAELGVVGIIALLALGPDEMVKILSFLKKTTDRLKREVRKQMDMAREATGENDLVKIIFDENGSPQKAYDMDKIKPLLKKADPEL
jgi:Sec-independent protein translocase protein TatA